MSDLERYRTALAPVEADARDQPWADRRPWRTATHVGLEAEVVVVDLHDLGAGLAKRAVRTVLAEPPAAGAVVFVHGRGRHTLGAVPVVTKVTHEALRRACTDNPLWTYRTLGAARTAWISDRERAPRSVTGGAGWGLKLLLALILAAFVVALANALGLFETH